MFHIKPLYIYISLTRQFPLISQQIYFLRELGDLKNTSYACENCHSVFLASGYAKI